MNKLIKKTLIVLSLIICGVSYYLLVVTGGVSIKVWLLVSLGPYLLLAVAAILLNISFWQSVLIPILLFYSIGTVLNIPWQTQYAYAHVAAILMLLIVLYFSVGLVVKLKFFSIIFGAIVGVGLFIGVKICQKNFISHEDLEKVPYLENRLLY